MYVYLPQNLHVYACVYTNKKLHVHKALLKFFVTLAFIKITKNYYVMINLDKYFLKRFHFKALSFKALSSFMFFADLVFLAANKKLKKP